MRLVLIVFLFFPGSTIYAQTTVTYCAADSLKITADLYLRDYSYPYILLFHQEGSSRGEYSEIALKLLNLEYNCLAVDLRSGGEENYIRNETHDRARALNMSHTQRDALMDITASVNYILKISDKKVILMGSSYSASLCLMAANHNPDVIAVIACSPGEYFLPWIEVKENLKNFDKPLFCTTSATEYKYVTQMLNEISDTLKVIFKPGKGKGLHGAKALWVVNETSQEYWLELLIFFKGLKELDNQ